MPPESQDTRGFGTDVLSLLEQLEHVVSDARHIPLSSRAIVDADELMTIIEQIKTRLPAELRESKWLLMERDRILAEAREQAGRVVDEARQKMAEMTEDAVITQEAESQAQEIVDKARKVAREIRYGALDYADSILARLEQTLTDSMQQVEKGRSELKNTR